MPGRAEPRQRIGRLAPLPDVGAAIARGAAPVAPREIHIGAALGRVLAAEPAAAKSVPESAAALLDGWAVSAALVADAGPYAPVPLTDPPRWLDAGDPLPAGCDAVLAPDALADGEAIAPAAPGEGVLPAGFDAPAGARLGAAGAALRAADVAVLRAAGIARVRVRIPRVSVIRTAARFDAVAQFVAAAVAGAGGEADYLAAADAPDGSAQALMAAPGDAVIMVGGTGEGRSDRAVYALREAGEVLIHGMAIRRAETAGLGTLGKRPALLLPGRLDAALAAWLLVGHPLVARLAGARAAAPGRHGVLARKLVSPIGLAEAALVRRHADGDKVEPIAGGALPLRALAEAVGWVLVAPESEGYAAGTTVEVNPLP